MGKSVALQLLDSLEYLIMWARLAQLVSAKGRWFTSHKVRNPDWTVTIF
jgi:hypothetical protein